MFLFIVNNIYFKIYIKLYCYLLKQMYLIILIKKIINLYIQSCEARLHSKQYRFRFNLSIDQYYQYQNIYLQTPENQLQL